VSGPQDIQAVSSVALEHFHRTTIPGRDVDSPPAGGRTYVSTVANDHTHGVKVSEQQLRDLQQSGAVVSVTSQGPSSGAAHSHVFTFER
jgi:hypothetical protein